MGKGERWEQLHEAEERYARGVRARNAQRGRSRLQWLAMALYVLVVMVMASVALREEERLAPLERQQLETLRGDQRG